MRSGRKDASCKPMLARWLQSAVLGVSVGCQNAIVKCGQGIPRLRIGLLKYPRGVLQGMTDMEQSRTGGQREGEKRKEKIKATGFH